MRAELRIAGSRMGEEAMAKVSGWRADWRVERRVEVRVRRLFSSWRKVVSGIEDWRGL
jgi:hypothetical protein